MPTHAAIEVTMTEAEWLAAVDPEPMLSFLRGKASDRQLRLLAIACCRRLWHLVTENEFRNAVIVAERFVNGSASEADLLDKYQFAGGAAGDDAANIAFADTAAPPGLLDVAKVAKRTAQTVGWMAWGAAADPDNDFRGADAACEAVWKAERAAQAQLVRDIFGNPFR
jgi:hypothetical protein